jgi:hypothetical protein
MSNDVVTLALDGEPSLDDFAIAIEKWRELVALLTAEIAPDADVQWLIDGLERSSAIATVRAVAPDAQRERVRDVVRAYERVGAALETGEQVPFSAAISLAASTLTTVLNGRVSSISLSTSESDFTVYSPQATIDIAPVARRAGAYGAVEGRVQTISNRGGLRFTVYRSIDQKAVSCYVEDGWQDIMTDAWGKVAVVEGWVTRDRLSDRPKSVRHVRTITIKGDGNPGDWREARGAVPVPIGAMSAESAVSRVRDGD